IVTARPAPSSTVMGNAAAAPVRANHAKTKAKAAPPAAFLSALAIQPLRVKSFASCAPPPPAASEAIRKSRSAGGGPPAPQVAASWNPSAQKGDGHEGRRAHSCTRRRRPTPLAGLLAYGSGAPRRLPALEGSRLSAGSGMGRRARRSQWRGRGGIGLHRPAAPQAGELLTALPSARIPCSNPGLEQAATDASSGAR